MEEKFYFCKKCGNLAVMITASGVTPKCCGDDMECLVAHTGNEGIEKHLTVVEKISDNEVIVRVGSNPHPMVEAHYIEFICLQTSTGFVISRLKPEEKPEVRMCFTGTPIAVYAYCNIHGLWRTDL